MKTRSSSGVGSKITLSFNPDTLRIYDDGSSDEEERQIEAASLTIKDFEDPSWSHKQAFRLGEKARIKKLRDLLDFI
jgi:hypothetical protein